MNQHNTLRENALREIEVYMFGSPTIHGAAPRSMNTFTVIDKITTLSDRLFQNHDLIPINLSHTRGLKRKWAIDYDNDASDPQTPVLAIIGNPALKPWYVEDDLFTRLHTRSHEQRKLIRILKTNFIELQYHSYLYDIVYSHLDRNDIEQLLRYISTGWNVCETLNHVSSFSNTMNALRDSICEIAFACERLQNHHIEILLFSCLNIFYNVLCHDNVDFSDWPHAIIEPTSLLRTKASTDWFKPLITNARELGLDEMSTPEPVWKHFWALVINFYKVDFHSCTRLYTFSDRRDPQMSRCAESCSYNRIQFRSKLFATDELLTYIVQHQNTLSKSQMIITPIYHLDHTQTAGERKELPWYKEYDNVNDIAFLQATKYIPIISENHMFLLVVYYVEVADTSNSDLMNQVQMITSIDSSKPGPTSHYERKRDYQMLKPLVVSWFHKIRPQFKETKIITSRNVQISPKPQIHQFIEESNICSSTYVHLSLLLCGEYITYDILLLSVIKMIRDRITNTNLNANANPNPNPSSSPIHNLNSTLNTTPTQGDTMYSFYFYCLLKMVTKSNRGICSGQCN